jgi:hypothetical protein
MYLLICLILCTSVYGHFAILEPIRSRELAYGKLPWAYFPVNLDGRDGGPDNPPQSFRHKANCLEYPPVKPYSIKGGSTIDIKFEASNMAYHVGPCRAYLVKPSTMEVMVLTEDIQDCVHKQMNAATYEPFKVTIPKIRCDKCVLRVDVTATHLVTTYEYFNSCIDVKIH